MTPRPSQTVKKTTLLVRGGSPREKEGPTPIRAVLVDDERLARQGMRELLAAHREVEVVGEAEDAATAAMLIRTERPQAIFLDIEMPLATGFELLRDLEDPPRVVFVTAHSEHAVQAFDVDAVDYLLKPVRPERLAEAIRRLRAAGETGYRRGDRICLRTPERTLVAPLDQVVALRADGDFTRVFVAGERPLLICQTLGSYERTLPAPPFARLDRSLLLNLEAITRVLRRSRDEEHVWVRGIEESFVLGRKASGELARRLA